MTATIQYTPKQAPIFGGQSIFVSCGGISSPLNNDGMYYLTFEGSKIRHFTSAKMINPFTLQAIIPSHDIAEAVLLSVLYKQGSNPVTLCNGTFTFTLDTATLFAQSLAMNSTNALALKQLEIMYGTLLVGSQDEHEVLDARLTSAFEKLQLSDVWNLCDGNDWTLLHFCAQYSLEKLARYLIGKRGASDALNKADGNGKKPINIAEDKLNITLIELFSRPPLEESNSQVEETNVKPIVKRHQLGTTTISTNIHNDRTIELDAQLLEDLQNLAVESKRNSDSSGNIKPEEKQSRPLAHSLQKLREINLEIQRLRCLTQIDENQTDVLLNDRRARSFSCPDSFNNAKQRDKNHGYLRGSLSLTSCDEENLDSSMRQDDTCDNAEGIARKLSEKEINENSDHGRNSKEVAFTASDPSAVIRAYPDEFANEKHNDQIVICASLEMHTENDIMSSEIKGSVQVDENNQCLSETEEKKESMTNDVADASACETESGVYNADKTPERVLSDDKSAEPVITTEERTETDIVTERETGVCDERHGHEVNAVEKTSDQIINVNNNNNDNEILDTNGEAKQEVLAGHEAENDTDEVKEENSLEADHRFDSITDESVLTDRKLKSTSAEITNIEDSVDETKEVHDDPVIKVIVTESNETMDKRTAVEKMRDDTDEGQNASLLEKEFSVKSRPVEGTYCEEESRTPFEVGNDTTLFRDRNSTIEELKGDNSKELTEDIATAADLSDTLDLNDIEIEDMTSKQPDAAPVLDIVNQTLANHEGATVKEGTIAADNKECSAAEDTSTQENSGEALVDKDMCDGMEGDSQNVSMQSYDQQDFSGRPNSNIVPEARPLAAVTEETEEELLELDDKVDGDFQKYGKSHSLEEIKKIKQLEQRMHRSAEQVYIPREVAVLRRGILKKERPLSDNYENIKMIEREYQLNRLSRHSESEESLTSLDKRKSKSLDALSMDEDSPKSPSLTSSQLSIHGSTESLPSIDVIDSRGMLLYRSQSVGASAARQRASLNDICLSVRDENEEPVRLNKKRRSRFSFKRKSKSTTALDKKDSELTDEDRRRTIIGGVSTEKLLMARKSSELETNGRRVHPEKNRYNNRDSGIDSTCDLHLDDIIISTTGSRKENNQTAPDASSNFLHVQKDRNRTSSEISGDSRDTEDEVDADTDEGTSSEIAERVRKSSICAEEKKKEKKFGILRSKPKKDKKQSKDKEAIEAKLAKKSHKDTKASFLGKKPSFRQGQRASLSSNTLSAENKMFARSSSIGKPGANPKHSSSMDNLRGSGRGFKVSPSSVRKASHEVDGVPDSDNSNSNLSALNNLNVSTHSLDSLSLEDLADDPYQVDDWSQYDSDLEIKKEPETWSNLVERKIQRKLHAKDIKRQDVIYELIFTESNYVRTLKIVSRIYCIGLKRELGLDDQTVEELFPRVADLLEINETFCKRMKKRQGESNNNVIEDIGDILVDQFSGANGEFMKEVYGYFCSRHLQAVALYKELMKTDKKFAVFVKKCMLNARVRRLSIPECITLATQRLTKYPLLFEAILKATKESKSDYENIKKALRKVKEVLQAVDEYVRKYEKEQELMDLRKRFDARGEVQYKNGQTFKNSKLFSKRSVLIHEGTLTWKGKGKSVESKAVLLADKIFFLQEKDQRLSLLSLDNKAPVIYLRSLIVREVATDMKALYLVNNEGPEMYELVCSSTKSKMQWITMIMDAIKNKPDDEEDNLSDLEEEMRKEEESRITRLKEIIEHLQTTDNKVADLITDKNRLVVEMRELIQKMGSSKDGAMSNLDLNATDVLEGRETLERAISEAGSLTTLLCDGEIAIQPQSSQYPATQVLATAPKRAETFGGFDRNSKSLMPPPHVSRASSLKQENRLSVAGKIQGTFETDHGGKDPKERVRKTSQGLMSVITRNKPLGSTEDLSSTSSSNLNMPQFTNSTAQKLLAVTQLKDYLTSLMDVTNKQDIELASIRVELHQSRSEINKLRTERQNIEERLIQQQREHERQLNRQKESYAKLEREFKRTVEKFNKQIEEHKFQQQIMKDKYTELHKSVFSMQNSSKSKQNSSSMSSIRQKHHALQDQEPSNSKRHTTHEDYDSQDVIFF